MKSQKSNVKVARIGIDLAKNTLELYGESRDNKMVIQKSISRAKVLEFTTNINPTNIAMESCSSSHFWGREFVKQGHTVKLIPAQHVKPFVKTHKNDRVDAIAICEASSRPNMHCVPIKSIEQQDIQAMHRIRQLIVKHRTALTNQIRGFLNENGIVIAEGIKNVFEKVPFILENAENGLSGFIRHLLNEQFDDLKYQEKRLDAITSKIEEIAKNDPICKRLLTIDGFGPMTATAIYAAIGTGTQFNKGRDMSAWLGMVPKQHSTGGRSRLGRISKRGNRYIRSLVISGARAVVKNAPRKDTRLSKWIENIKAKKGYNVAVVALANKNMRVAWALLTKGGKYNLDCQEQLARKYSHKVA